MKSIKLMVAVVGLVLGSHALASDNDRAPGIFFYNATPRENVKITKLFDDLTPIKSLSQRGVVRGAMLGGQAPVGMYALFYIESKYINGILYRPANSKQWTFYNTFTMPLDQLTRRKLTDYMQVGKINVQGTFKQGSDNLFVIKVGNNIGAETDTPMGSNIIIKMIPREQAEQDPEFNNIVYPQF
jgi:hypothetical protein